MAKRQEETKTVDLEAVSAGTVRAVSRALAILKAFEGVDKLQLRDVAENASLDRATTRRLLLTLMAEGMVRQDEETGFYFLGPAIRRLARSVQEVDPRQVLAPHMERIARDWSVTVFLSEYRDHRAICLERRHDHKAMEVHFWSLGGSLQINCGAGPKVLLAWQSEEEIDLMLAQPLTALTPKSVTDRKRLKAQLKLIRKRGWELAVDDVVVGLSALAVPLLNTNDQLRGCLSIAGLTAPLIKRRSPSYLERLIELQTRLRPLLD